MYYRLAFLAFWAIMSIAAVAAPRPAPDLVVGAVVASHGSITIRVHNRGNADAGASKIGISLGAPIGTTTNYDQPAIPAGEWATVRVEVGKPLAGVRCVVREDVTHAVAESHENNNATSGIF